MSSDLSSDQYDLVVSICKYLQELGTLNFIDSDSIEVAVQCIGEATGVDSSKTPSRYIPPLMDIFRTGMPGSNVQNGHADKYEQFLSALKDKGFFQGCPEGSPEYQVRLQSAKENFSAEFGNATTNVTTSQIEDSENLKVEGNLLLSDGDVQRAIACYTKAIALNPSNAILFANRAAAFSKQAEHQLAVDDCLRAIDLDYNYTKAHYRCGVSYSFLGQVDKAHDCFDQALATCADKSSALAGEIREAQASLNEETNSSAGLDGIFSTNPELSAIFNTPGVKEQVEQVMQNPDMLSGMMNGMFGGGRPQATGSDTSPMSLMSDPAAFRAFMNSSTVKGYEQDPELGPVIADLRTNGIGALMKHLSNPLIISKLGALMKMNSQAPSP